MSNWQVPPPMQGVLGADWIEYLGKAGCINPYKPESVQPASYDCHAERTIKGLQSGYPLDVAYPLRAQWTEFEMPADGYVLYPGMFLLMSTEEVFGFPQDTAGMVQGLSTLARLGLTIHQTGGWIDPGFQGQITLEVTCTNGAGIRLRPGMRICQVVFLPVTLVTPRGYEGRYQGQSGPTPARNLFAEYVGQQVRATLTA